MTELFGHQWLKIRLLITHWGSPDHHDFDYLYIRYEWKNWNFTFLFPLAHSIITVLFCWENILNINKSFLSLLYYKCIQLFLKRPRFPLETKCFFASFY